MTDCQPVALNAGAATRRVSLVERGALHAPVRMTVSASRSEASSAVPRSLLMSSAAWQSAWMPPK